MILGSGLTGCLRSNSREKRSGWYGLPSEWQNTRSSGGKGTALKPCSPEPPEQGGYTRYSRNAGATGTGSAFSSGRLDQPEIDRLVAAYRTGRSLADLAGEFRIHRPTVAAHLEARGKPRRINKPKMTAADTHDAPAATTPANPSQQSPDPLESTPSTVRRSLKRPRPEQNP